MKFISILTSMFLLSACGQEENSQSQANPANETGMQPSALEELRVSPQFDFIGGETLTIRIVDENPAAERRYLNVCSNFAEEKGEYRLFYDSCLLRTSTSGQLNEFEIVISHSQQKLIAQLWPMTREANPENFFWSRMEQGNHWEISTF